MAEGPCSRSTSTYGGRLEVDFFRSFWTFAQHPTPPLATLVGGPTWLRSCKGNTRSVIRVCTTSQWGFGAAHLLVWPQPEVFCEDVLRSFWYLNHQKLPRERLGTLDAMAPKRGQPLTHTFSFVGPSTSREGCLAFSCHIVQSRAICALPASVVPCKISSM